jgi:hypothetical protein
MEAVHIILEVIQVYTNLLRKCKSVTRMILLARVTTIHIVDIGFIRFYKYEQIHILKSQRYGNPSSW